MKATNELERRIYKLIFTTDYAATLGAAIVDHTDLKFILFSQLPTDAGTGGFEVVHPTNAPGYASIAVAGNMEAAGSGTGTWYNTVDLGFGINSGLSDWINIVGFGIKEQTSGTILMYSNFVNAQQTPVTYTVPPGKEFTIPAGSLVVTID
jgi:hypothetical protein